MNSELATVTEIKSTYDNVTVSSWCSFSEDNGRPRCDYPKQCWILRAEVKYDLCYQAWWWKDACQIFAKISDESVLAPKRNSPYWRDYHEDIDMLEIDAERIAKSGINPHLPKKQAPACFSFASPPARQ